MASGCNVRKEASTASYGPASLDFINRPNPVEPHAVAQRNPFDGTQRLDASSTQDLRRLLLDTIPVIPPAGEHPAKRQKTGDARLLDLPRLPARNGQVRKPRLPPTLSGLHQPPPNAGLLPSINVQQPPSTVLEGRAVDKPAATPNKPSSHKSVERVQETQKSTAKATKATRNKWSEEETACLLRGVARFGIGNWTKVLNCADYQFNRRTALDLKDRFRVCRPDDYSLKNASSPTESPVPTKRTIGGAAIPNRKARAKTDRKDGRQLAELGIEAPFEKSTRRQRHGYTEGEDEALERGFYRHLKPGRGKPSWIAIQQDEELKLSHRTPTDLRDRFRLKHPEAYKRAGLAAKAGTLSGEQKNPSVKISNPLPAEKSVDMAKAAIIQKPTLSKAVEVPMPAGPGKPTTYSSFFFSDDVFLGAPFGEDDEEDQELPVLDRRILDWPTDPGRSAAQDAARGSIDPLQTLKLPIPSASHFKALNNPANSSSAQLPSLAAITIPIGADEDGYDQLELPSLMQCFGMLETDARISGNTFLSLDELLIQQ